MANEEHRNILRQGVNAWNQWREDNPAVVPDLKEEDLSGVNLHLADIQDARLQYAQFSSFNLSCKSGLKL